MKTVNLVESNNSDPVWASNVELLPSEECLPVIGSCQVSSILQNLDTTHNDHNLQNMDLIILHGNDYKLPLDTPLNLHTNNFVVLKDSATAEPPADDPASATTTNGTEKWFEKQRSCVAEESESNEYTVPVNTHLEETKNLQPTDLSLNIAETSNLSNTSSISPKHYDKESFEDMLYFVCNLCPFLCTKERKITQHLESNHKYKTVSKLVQLKCPACANIFYHRASLKSHLLHDHCVASNDLNLIVQAVMFYSNKENKKEESKMLNDNKEVAKCEKTISDADISKGDGLKMSSHANKYEGSTGFCRTEQKDVINLVKPLHKNTSNSATNANLDSNLSKAFEIKKNAEPQVLLRPPATMPGKIPLPQVDITTNNSEKLITNLMKKTEPVVKYINSQKCAYASCKVLLSDSEKMDYHIESHWNDGFKCLECQEKFMLWKPLISHLWRIHKIDMELFACDKCDYKTNSLSKLNTVHKLIHSNVKAFQCDTCQKSFKNQKQLRNHRRIHRQNIDKDLETCETCSKSFSDKRRLKNHMDSVHKKLKPFLCNYCGYKGSCRASLRMHIRCHTGEKPFSCDQCQYTTADHNSLRRHRLRHTGQKPYKCSYCTYACIQSSTYKVHLKTKHPGMEKDLMFTCLMCQFRTVNKDMYNSHLVSVHKQKPVG